LRPNETSESEADPPPTETVTVPSSLFPYVPYPEQLGFMRDIVTVLGEGGILVAEACNGFGKTICALSSLLPMDRKILYATRTHEQVRQVLHEIDRINQKAGTDFSAVAMASRQNLCLNESCRRLPPVEAAEACRVLRQRLRCRYRTKPSSVSTLPSVLSTRRLIQFGKARNLCPYFLSRKAAETSTVVVAPYQYIFNEKIRTAVGLELRGKTLVFDEAHNADKIGQDVLSDSLSERSLENAKKELDLLGYPSELFDDLRDYIDENVSAEPVAKPGSDLARDLKHLLDSDLSSFVGSFAAVVDEVRDLKVSRGEVPLCYLNGVLSFLSLVGSGEAERYVAIYRQSSSGLGLIEYRCLDPSLAIRPVIEEACGALVMSGTLSPLNLFIEVLGIPEAETRTYSGIAQPENVRTFVDTSVTTRFQERNTEMLKFYGARIAGLMKKVPNGALIFFPQRRLMMEALTSWRKNGFITKKGKTLTMGEKSIFVEGVRASENARIVDQYKKAAKSGKGAVLFAVFRGRNAEGSNFPYEEARGIFNAGLPYADYRDPVVRAQIGYLNKKRPRLGELWYIMDAFRAANQAMGRGIRHRDDWCHFFLMDRRYATHWKLISKWAVQNGIEEVQLD